MEKENELIGSAEAAKLLGIERTTLYGWTSKKLLPFVRVSRNLIKFRREELQSWIAERRVESIGGQEGKSRSATPGEPKPASHASGGKAPVNKSSKDAEARSRMEQRSASLKKSMQHREREYILELIKRERKRKESRRRRRGA